VSRYTNGARVCCTHAYNPRSYPFDLIGPVQFLWKVRPPAVPERINSKAKQSQTEPIQDRTMWIRCHPVIYESVLAAVQYAIQDQLFPRSNDKEIKVVVTDLRDQFNIFELVGPKSSQVIHGALEPIKAEDRPEFKQVSHRHLRVAPDSQTTVLERTRTTADSGIRSSRYGYRYASDRSSASVSQFMSLSQDYR
jgi:hypothetical protein